MENQMFFMFNTLEKAQQALNKVNQKAGCQVANIIEFTKNPTVKGKKVKYGFRKPHSDFMNINRMGENWGNDIEVDTEDIFVSTNLIKGYDDEQ